MTDRDVQLLGDDGVAVALEGEAVSVGRDQDDDVVVPSDGASRHHARFERAGAEVRVVDLGSTNGTRVNGEVLHEEARPPAG